MIEALFKMFGFEEGKNMYVFFWMIFEERFSLGSWTVTVRNRITRAMDTTHGASFLSLSIGWCVR